MKKQPVWDWPVRVGHWLLVSGFIIAWLSGDSENWRLVHAYAGGMVLAVILFRLLWGFIGSHYARFTTFVWGYDAVWDYLRSLWGTSPKHFTGHNPAGGVAIVALLTTGLLCAVGGWLTYQEIGGEWLEEFHEVMATAMLMVVIVHLLGVLVGSFIHRENLVSAMLTGKKLANESDPSMTHSYFLAGLFLLFWTMGFAWLCTL